MVVSRGDPLLTTDQPSQPARDGQYVTSRSYLLREGLLLPALSRALKTNKKYCMVANPNSHNLQLAEGVRHWICQQSSKILSDIAPRFPEVDVVTSPVG